MNDKAIEKGKEHREPYHGAKAIDRTCRNHGMCPYCRDNRLFEYVRHKFLKADSSEDDGLLYEDYKEDNDEVDN